MGAVENGDPSRVGALGDRPKPMAPGGPGREGTGATGVVGVGRIGSPTTLVTACFSDELGVVLSVVVSGTVWGIDDGSLEG